MSTGDEGALTALKAAFERQERLRTFIDDNQWLTRPLVDETVEEALTDPKVGLSKGLLEGKYANFDGGTVLDAAKLFLNSGSDDTFAEFVHRLQEKLRAEVENMKYFVTSLDRYSSCANSGVSASKRAKKPTVPECRKSARLSVKAARSGKKEIHAKLSTEELQKAGILFYGDYM